MDWIKIGLFVIRHWTRIKSLLGAVKSVAEDLKKETGIGISEAVGTTVEETKKSIPSDVQVRDAWMNRGNESSGH